MIDTINHDKHVCDVCGGKAHTYKIKSVFGEKYFYGCDECVDKALEPYQFIIDADQKYGLESYSPAVQTFAITAIKTMKQNPNKFQTNNSKEGIHHVDISGSVATNRQKSFMQNCVR